MATVMPQAIVTADQDAAICTSQITASWSTVTMACGITVAIWR